jgi:purine nucleoside permease
VLGAPHPLRYNAAGLYASVAGNTRDTSMTTVPASELIMSLCLDPQLDLRKTYWLINGISGIDPAAGSIGSAVWTANVVDGDAMREIDESEVPAGWPYGLFAIGTSAPNTLPPRQATAGGWGGATLAYTMNTPLNPRLASWALALSRSRVTLQDEPALLAWRSKFTGYPLAQHPPEIILGAALSSARYWHGPRRTQWARDWVRLWTDGKDAFATTAMEPSAYVGSLQRMAAKGLVDFNRVMMLRGASNYCLPPPGQNVMSTVGDESLGTLPALEANYRVGSVVVHELLAHWDLYEDHVPGN